MPRRFGPHKYDPLTVYLTQARGDRVTLTLAEIETLLGVSLPAAATWSSFWRNYVHTWPAHAWRDAGWRVARQARNRPVEAVTFVREPPDSTP